MLLGVLLVSVPLTCLSSFGTTVDATVSPSVTLMNTGTVTLTINYGDSTETVAPGRTITLSTSPSTIDVQATVNDNPKTIASINYPSSASCGVSKGNQVPNAKFTLTIPMRA